MGSLYKGEVIIKKGMNNNKVDRSDFTASPDKSNTDYAVLQMSI